MSTNEKLPPRVVICQNEMRAWREETSSAVKKFEKRPAAYPIEYYGPTEGQDDEYLSLTEHTQLLEQARFDAVCNLWKMINNQMPTLHFCMEWDYMLIHDKSPEFEACLCGPFPLKCELEPTQATKGEK